MTSPIDPSSMPINHTVRMNIPSIYVEGLSQLMVGFPNSRLFLHSIAQRDLNVPGGMETRQLACELVMSTSAMIEMAQTIIHALVQNQTQLEAAKLEWLGKLEMLTRTLKGLSDPANPNVNH
jgi:hypothetical protein